MDAILHDFLEQIGEKSHLRPLLWRNFYVFINCEDQQFKRSIALHNLRYTDDNELTSLTISGSGIQIEKLLKGEVALRKLMEEHNLRVTGSHKEVLRLESLCLLNQTS